MEDLENVLKENLEYYLTQERNIVSRLALLPKGNIKKKRKSNEWYYYLQYRKGKQVKDEYIGKIVPDQLREKLLQRRVLLDELIKVRKSIKLLKQKSPPAINLLSPVKGIVKYAKLFGTKNTFIPRMPASNKVKFVRIKWRFLGDIASPMKSLHLYEYPGEKVVAYRANPSGTTAKFPLSIFKTANTYKVSLMKPVSQVLKPLGKNLDPQSFIGIGYHAQYEDAKTLPIY